MYLEILTDCRLHRYFMDNFIHQYFRNNTLRTYLDLWYMDTCYNNVDTHFFMTLYYQCTRSICSRLQEGIVIQNFQKVLKKCTLSTTWREIYLAGSYMESKNTQYCVSGLQNVKYQECDYWIKSKSLTL